MNEKGLTLLELLITLVIIFILASIAQPISRVSERRVQEVELRQDLRAIREAIDRFKEEWDQKKISHLETDVANEESGYPKRLEVLIEGAPSSAAEGGVRKFLRRIPVDPMTGSRDWGLRCHEDAPDSAVWCGDDVYDIYTKSGETALDGTRYDQW